MKKIDVETLGLDDGAAIERLMRRFYPLVIEAAVLDAEDQMGITGAFDLDNPRVQDVLDRLAGQVRGVAATTKADIQKLVGEAADKGWSHEELAKAIRDAGEIDSVSRSVMIARTETATAYTAGSRLAYADSGVVGKVEWIATDPCPICAPYAAQKAELDGGFDGGLDGPPAHPNCRCALLPVLKD